MAPRGLARMRRLYFEFDLVLVTGWRLGAYSYLANGRQQAPLPEVPGGERGK